MQAQHPLQSSSSAMALARCRELLGDEASGLSDGDVERIRQHADAMARVIVHMFLNKAA